MVLAHRYGDADVSSGDHSNDMVVVRRHMEILSKLFAQAFIAGYFVVSNLS